MVRAVGAEGLVEKVPFVMVSLVFMGLAVAAKKTALAGPD